MNQIGANRKHSMFQMARAKASLVLRPVFAAVLAFALCLAVRADTKRDEARTQFARAVKERTYLEGLPENDRSLADYKRTVGEFQKVYMITPQTEDAAPSIVAEAEMYEAMGRLYDPKYFQLAVEKYDFLLSDYPESRFRAQAMFTIGEIQHKNLNDPTDAEISLKDFIKRFPRSPNAAEARQSLKEILAGANDAGAPNVSNNSGAGALPQNGKQDGKQNSQQNLNPPKSVQNSNQDNRQSVSAENGSPDASKDGDSAPSQEKFMNVGAQPLLAGERVEPRVADGHMPSLKDIRTWNTDDSTRIVVTLTDTIKFDSARISSPERIYFNLYRAELGPKLSTKDLPLGDGMLKSVRVAQNKPDTVRVVLDVDGAKNYDAYLLSNPYRLVIEVESKSSRPSNMTAKAVLPMNPPPNHPTNGPANSPVNRPVSVFAKMPALPVDASPQYTIRPLQPFAETVYAENTSPAKPASKETLKPKDVSPSPRSQKQNDAIAKNAATPAPNVGSGRPVTSIGITSSKNPPKLSAVTDESLEEADSLSPSVNASSKTKSNLRADAAIVSAPDLAAEAKPMRDGQRSLTRILGLKVSRIVIDAGHGGHDTGTVGSHGLMEKDLCLDVALRLGHLIEQKLPNAEVVYTRTDDTFIPLEQRTAIANDAKADLFVSIHANSSQDPSARGIETYYLNFATSAESMEVAARENALSQGSLHDLEDIIQKIARNEKIEESKDLASDIQDSLTQRLQLISESERDRGVKKAPFVVLIGANMPSILSEISFVSNPNDERLLRKPEQRQRIADGLYRGITTYLDSMNSLSLDKRKLVSDNHADAGTVASTGNQK